MAAVCVFGMWVDYSFVPRMSCRLRGMEELVSCLDDLAALRRALDLLDNRIEREAAVCTTRLSDLRRQHKAAPKRRGGAGSIDAKRYALGASLALVGAGDVDRDALLGLMAHPVQMLRWMTYALVDGAGPTFGAVIDAVLADSSRRTWCEQWGRILRWREQKQRYDAAVASFLVSGRTGAHEPWRREPATDDQIALVQILAGLLGEPIPDVSLRGPAFEWILERGGNPTY